MGRIAIEWVRQYKDRHKLEDLNNSQRQAEGFYGTLDATRHFAWGDDHAHDTDFEQQSAGLPASGDDVTWVETVDMMYFSGHGTPASFEFAEGDDARAKAAEIRWGDRGRLKWVVIDACDVLFSSDLPGQPTVFDRWAQAFDGVHHILGFATVVSDDADRGRIFAQYLNAGNTIRQAWIKACQDTESGHVEWAYLRADGDGISTSDDHWIGKGSVVDAPCPPTVIHYARGRC